jgi:hypothetical protein
MITVPIGPRLSSVCTAQSSRPSARMPWLTTARVSSTSAGPSRDGTVWLSSSKYGSSPLYLSVTAACRTRPPATTDSTLSSSPAT